jgi:CMP-N-acetylneuraminic acid synthetase
MVIAPSAALVPTTFALIPLRGGSKSIPKKNIKPLAGQPLCAWVLQAASAAAHIDVVYVSTDCPEIAAVVRALDLGVEIINRPAALATDEASTEAVMLHFIEQVPCERLVTIQATSPQLTAADLDAALARFERDGLDSLLSAVRTKRFFWQDDATPINYDPIHRPRRQDFAGTLMENGAFYITRRGILEYYHCRLGGRIGIHEMPEHSAMEIDEPEDWARVEALLLQKELH